MRGSAVDVDPSVVGSAVVSTTGVSVGCAVVGGSGRVILVVSGIFGDVVVGCSVCGSSETR